MAKQHNWALTPNHNPDNYAGFVSFQEGCEVIGLLGKRKVNAEGRAHYSVTLEEPCTTVFAHIKDGSICTVEAGNVVGVSEVPALRHLESLEGRIVRITHIATDVRKGEARARLQLSVEVAQDE